MGLKHKNFFWKQVFKQFLKIHVPQCKNPAKIFFREIFFIFENSFWIIFFKVKLIFAKYFLREKITKKNKLNKTSRKKFKNIFVNQKCYTKEYQTKILIKKINLLEIIL